MVEPAPLPEEEEEEVLVEEPAPVAEPVEVEPAPVAETVEVGPAPVAEPVKEKPCTGLCAWMGWFSQNSAAASE